MRRAPRVPVVGWQDEATEEVPSPPLGQGESGPTRRHGIFLEEEPGRARGRPHGHARGASLARGHCGQESSSGDEDAWEAFVAWRRSCARAHQRGRRTEGRTSRANARTQAEPTGFGRWGAMADRCEQGGRPPWQGEEPKDRGTQLAGDDGDWHPRRQGLDEVERGLEVSPPPGSVRAAIERRGPRSAEDMALEASRCVPPTPSRAEAGAGQEESAAQCQAGSAVRDEMHVVGTCGQRF